MTADAEPLIAALIQAVKMERDEFNRSDDYSTEALVLAKERVALCKAALLDAMSRVPSEAGGSVWIVMDESGQPDFVCSSKQGAQEHINDAITDDGIEEASDWIVREYVPAPPLGSEACGARAVVDEQAEDESLWFVAKTITETILQKALRRLHAAVEADPAPPRGGELPFFTDPQGKPIRRMSQAEFDAMSEHEAKVPVEPSGALTPYGEQLEAFRTAIFAGCTNELYCGLHPHDLWETISGAATTKPATVEPPADWGIDEACKTIESYAHYSSAIPGAVSHLRRKIASLRAALKQVGDDYPGSSCQQWCYEQAGIPLTKD